VHVREGRKIRASLTYRKVILANAPMIVVRWRSTNRSTQMMDVMMLALTFGWFALAIGYAYACERL
jgi:hypothetical protein